MFRKITMFFIFFFFVVLFISNGFAQDREEKALEDIRGVVDQYIDIISLPPEISKDVIEEKVNALADLIDFAALTGTDKIDKLRENYRDILKEEIKADDDLRSTYQKTRRSLEIIFTAKYLKEMILLNAREGVNKDDFFIENIILPDNYDNAFVRIKSKNRILTLELHKKYDRWVIYSMKLKQPK